MNRHEAQQQKKKPACVWITLERIGEMLYQLQIAPPIINISGFFWLATTVAVAKTRSQMGPDRLLDGPSTVTLATPDNC